MTDFNSPFFAQGSETIQQEPPQEIEYAGFFRRFGGYLVDSAIISIISGIISQVIMVLMGGNLTELMNNANIDPNNPVIPPEIVSSFGDIFFVLLIANFILSWLYFAGFEGSGLQATPGKRIFGMRVADLDGDPIGFGAATGRFLGKAVSSLIFGIGYLMAAFTSKKQALHDMIAGTVVLLR